MERPTLPEECFKWKGIYRNLVQEKLELEKALEFTTKQYNAALHNERELLKDTTNLKTSATEKLQSTIMHLSELDNACQMLPEKVLQLETTISAITNEKESMCITLKSEMAESCERHNREISEIRRLCQEQVKNDAAVYVQTLEEKELEIKRLLEQAKENDLARKDEMTQVKLEYEQMILKLQEQQVKLMKSSTSTASSMKMDIMRQKLHSIQCEHSAEVTSLQKTIASLHLQMQHCEMCSMSSAYHEEFSDFMAFKKTKKTLT